MSQAAAVSKLPDPDQAHRFTALVRAIPEQPWYYSACRWMTSILAVLVLVHAAVMAVLAGKGVLDSRDRYDAAERMSANTKTAHGEEDWREVIERTRTMREASAALTVSGLLLGVSMIEAIAAVAGWALMLVIVDGAGKVRRL